MKSRAELEGRGDESLLETELLKARVKARLLGEPERAPQLGRFRLLHELGQGATGAVYEALDTRSGAHVALKLLRTRSARAVHSFKQEFRGLTHVVHENLVQLHELFADGDEWYFTMELVHGRRFTDHVRVAASGEGAHASNKREDASNKREDASDKREDASTGRDERCDYERLRPALGQLLSAVRAIHAAGKLHCDLKTSNVLVSEQGRVVVLDFGLLAHETEADVTGTREKIATADGTPPYMAPELDAGAPPSAASDAYAIGVMLFAALTGRLPFEGSWARLMQARAQQPAPRASSLEPAVPADLDALAAGLLASDPNARTTIEQALGSLHLRAAEAQASSPPVPGVRLIGREPELAALHAAFADVSAQQLPIAVLVSGHSGIGKSALAERFAAELRERALVLRGRCHERESLPYKAFDGVVDALGAQLRAISPEALHALDRRELGALLRIFPHLRRTPELSGESAPAPGGTAPALHGGTVLPASVRELRRLAFAGLKALLRMIARQQPLVLIVDDLQWADLDSARLLQELLGPPDAPALLYVGCYREHEAERSEFLRELIAESAARPGAESTARPGAESAPRTDSAARPGCERRFLALGPLAPEAAIALALEALRGAVDHPERACARIAAESEGVPLFVRELCTHFASDAARPDAGPSLAMLLAARVSALGPSEHCALCLLSLAARPLAESLLVHAISEEPAVQRTLRTLSVQGLVHADAAGNFVVYHDRLREHVTERMEAGQTAALHRRLARAYELTGDGEPEWLIEHWQAAGEHATAYGYAIAAAELAASKLAFNRAAALYAAALALAPTDDPRRVELGNARGDALVNAGRGAEAAQAFLAAVAGASSDAALELRCRAAQQYLRSGHLIEASGLLRSLLVEVGLHYPETMPAMAAQLVASRARRALRPRRRANTTPDPRLRRRLLVLQAVFRETIVTDPLRSPLFHAWFYETALRAGDEHDAFMAMIWDTYFYVVLRGPRAARAVEARLTHADERAQQLGTPYARANVEMLRGVAALFSSRYPAIVEHMTRALALYREQCLGATWEESITALALYGGLENVGPLTALCRDAPAQVRRAHERNDLLTDALLSVHMGVALIAEDRCDEAREFLAERMSRLSGAMDMQLMGVFLRAIDTELYAGDGAAAWRLVETHWPSYLKSGFDRLQFWSAFARMRRAHAAILLAVSGGDTAQPAHALERVAAEEARRLERMGRSDADVLACGIRGALAVRRGELSAAHAHMRTAVAITRGQGTPITAAAYQRQLGRIVPGAEGAALIAASDLELRALGIANPERWSNMYAPGF